MSTSGTIGLVYDGDCGLCRASIAWLERRDTDERIDAHPSSSCTWDDVDPALFLTTVVARSDEGVVTASTAAATALSVLPDGWGSLGRLALRANTVPLIKKVSDRCYYLVARHRIAISKLLVRCRLIDASCAVPTAWRLEEVRRSSGSGCSALDGMHPHHALVQAPAAVPRHHGSPPTAASRPSPPWCNSPTQHASATPSRARRATLPHRHRVEGPAVEVEPVSGM